MNQSKIYEDQYCRYFSAGEYEDLFAAQAEMEKATKWDEGATKLFRLVALPDRMSAEAKANDETNNIPKDVLMDTAENSGLILQYNDQEICIRDCAMRSLLQTIGIGGPAIARASREDLVTGLNPFFKATRDFSKVMIRAEKVSAVLSKNYQYMPVTKLLEICELLQKNFGIAHFVNGSIAHDLTVAEFEFPNSAQKITAAYNEALKANGRGAEKTLIPVVQLRVSDSCDEAAKLITFLKFGENRKMPIGGFSVKHVNPGVSKKSTNSRTTCLEKFEHEAKSVFAKMNYSIETLIPQMLQVKIERPGNCFVGLCKYANIPQKWGGIVEEAIRLDFPDGEDCCFLDVYEYLTETVANAIRSGLQPSCQRVIELEEGIFKVARNQDSWKKFDLPGTVAWSRTTSDVE